MVLLRLTVGVAILGLLIHFVPVRVLWTAVRRVSLGLWLAILFGYLAAHALGWVKWRMMVNLASTGLSAVQSARCYFGGLFATLFLPSILGGDVVRIGLALRLGRNRAGALLGSFVDRLVDLAALSCVAGIGALLIPEALQPQSRQAFVVAVAGVGGGLVVLLIVVMIAVTVVPAGRFSYRIRRHLVRLRRASRSMFREPQRVLLALAIGITVQTSFVLLTSVIASACGLPLPLRVWLFVSPLAKLAALLPVTQGGLGVREAALVALAAPFGAAPAITIAVGLVWEAIIIGGGLIAGLISFSLGRTAASDVTLMTYDVPRHDRGV